MVNERRVAFVGTYGGKIVVCAYGADGVLEVVSETGGLNRPGFLTLHPNGRFLYAVDEGADGKVAAFTVADDGALSPLGEVRSTGGADPCQLVVDETERSLVSVNYSSGSVSVHPIEVDGSLGERSDLVRHQGSGPDKGRQEGPHAHVARHARLSSENGEFSRLYVTDLGTDEIYAYDLIDGCLVRTAVTAVPPGTGPRHVVAVPSAGDGGSLYVDGELGSTVLRFTAAPANDGTLELAETLPATVAEPAGDNFPSEIAADSRGRFVYVANRGPDTVSTFAIEAGGSLRPVADVPTGGAWPRHLVTHKSGDTEFLYVANQNADVVVQFRIDDSTGVPTPTGDVLSVPAPACILFA